MPYISPNTTVMFIKNCPIESSYQNTLWFENATAQYNYFSGLANSTKNNYTYQRKERNVIRVAGDVSSLYNINYLMFNNRNYENKWYYAFVISVEYVNNETVDIRYEIDLIQTWLFDFTLRECFVEREHSESDNLGEHILPEPVELGEVVFDNYTKILPSLDTLAVIVAVVDTGEEASDGNVYDGVYSGVTYHAFSATDVTGINTLVERYRQSPDSIVAMYMCPMIVATEEVIPSGGIVITTTTSGWQHETQMDAIPDDADFDGYIPKNKKLLSYPYYFLHIDNGSSQSLALRFEFFSGGIPRVQFDSNKSTPVKITLRPNYYKGLGNNTLHTEVLTLENYPQCSWNIDSYKVWLSQNIVPLFIKSGSSIMQMATGLGTSILSGLSGNISGVLSGGAQGLQGAGGVQNNVAGFMLDKYTHSIAADICKGNINNGNVNVSHGYQNFYWAYAHIKGEYAKAIDDFFTMFGYSTKRVKVPNRTARPKWNYVKTVGCVINGSIPAEDERAICAIHDNGITYWKNGSEVGNYSLDNSPTD